LTPRGARTTPGTLVDARNHWTTAQEFARAARHDFDGGYWRPAYSHAILAVIHAADAVTLHFTRQRNSSDDHDAALSLVSSIPEFTGAPRDQFLRHFDALLDVKTQVQYSERGFIRRDAEQALQHLDRALTALADLARLVKWTR
jgi:hypothetical protein